MNRTPSLKRNRPFFLLVLLMFFAAELHLEASLPGVPQPEQEDGISLFDGESLDGWIQHEGNAPFKVENGAIVGTSVASGPHSYLCTKQMYEDFVLTFDVRMDSGFNSGVQIRSNISYETNQIYGPQVDILPAAAGYLYGLYERGSGRRGWLSEDRSVKNAFNDGEWNRFRVRAEGSRIQTWVNERQVADFKDSQIARTGFIALQVHATTEEKAGKQVKFKNIRLQPLDRDRWKTLFNGKNLDGWRNPYDHGDPKVKNGEIQLHADGGKYFLTTEDQYDDFVFEASVKMPDRESNSGIQFRSKVRSNHIHGYQAEVDPSDRSWSGGFYEKGKRGWIQNLKKRPEARAAFQPTGWNRFRIHAEGSRIRIYVNGFKTVDLTDEKYKKGHIALQHHGEKGRIFRFRNIRIRKLD